MFPKQRVSTRRRWAHLQASSQVAGADSNLEQAVMNPLIRRLLTGAACGIAAGCAARMAIRSYRRLALDGAVVLITGGSRGLGLLLARRFGQEGARVALCARDPDELARAEEELRHRGVEVMTAVCDVSDPGDVDRLIATVEQQWGRVDVLVNNAGVIQVGPLEEMTVADFEQAMGAHFWGPVYTSLAVLPGMRLRGQGRIVNIASFGGQISVPHLLPYCASKFALVGFSEGMRTALLKDGIYVSTVCPGPMRTGSPVNALFKGQHELEYVWFTVTDSVPVASIGGDRAARQIVDACRYGDPQLTLTLPARIASTFHGVAPGLVTDGLALVDRLLPAPGGIGTDSARGRDSRPDWLPGWLTTLTDQAARENNELAQHTPPRMQEISP
jgi:NAD(P)-dependent dehydrogenase (short-subunit alcohol dehydrogenase family)